MIGKARKGMRMEFCRDLGLLRAIGFVEETIDAGPRSMSVSFKTQNESHRLVVRGPGGRLVDRDIGYLCTSRREFGEMSMQPISFLAMDVRDVVALWAHLRYSYSHTVLPPPHYETLVPVTFRFRGREVSQPFCGENEFEWLGCEIGETVHLVHPAAAYGDAYLTWRDHLCGLIAAGTHPWPMGIFEPAPDKRRLSFER